MAPTFHVTFLDEAEVFLKIILISDEIKTFESPVLKILVQK